MDLTYPLYVARIQAKQLASFVGRIEFIELMEDQKNHRGKNLRIGKYIGV
jgi:hypothetical protein